MYFMIDLLFFHMALLWFCIVQYFICHWSFSNHIHRYFWFIVEFSCVVLHPSNYFVENDSIKAEN